jgi:hypothetical protein
MNIMNVNEIIYNFMCNDNFFIHIYKIFLYIFNKCGKLCAKKHPGRRVAKKWQKSGKKSPQTA